MVKNKRIARVALVAGGLTLLAGGVAFAYWAADGTGAGDAGAGETVAITAVQTSLVTNLGPGIAAQPLLGTFLNTNTNPVFVTDVTVHISSVELAPTATGTCDATDFALTGAVMPVGKEASADDSTAWSGATITFVNKATVNQDGCKGATVNLAYTIS